MIVHNRFKVCLVNVESFSGDNKLNTLKEIKDYDNEVDALDFIYEQCEKGKEYTILKTYKLD